MREPISLTIPDLSAFSRDLARALADNPTPGHLALLNMIARAAGYANFQHLRAQHSARAAVMAEAAGPDWQRLLEALRHFDDKGSLIRWPAKTVMQYLCVSALWARLPKGQVMTERQISALLNGWHSFGDAAILRRTMVERKRLSRTPDGREYLRVESAISRDEAALISTLKPRLG